MKLYMSYYPQMFGIIFEKKMVLFVFSHSTLYI